MFKIAGGDRLPMCCVALVRGMVPGVPKDKAELAKEEMLKPTRLSFVKLEGDVETEEGMEKDDEKECMKMRETQQSITVRKFQNWFRRQRRQSSWRQIHPRNSKRFLVVGSRITLQKIACEKI